MKPAKFEYERARDVQNALELLRQTDGDGKLIAGGQSLVPMMNLRLAQPGVLVDIRRLEELARVEQSNGHLFVGATVTHAAIEDGKVPDVTKGMMPYVAHRIAYRAVRNRGTIGGSLAHFDPAGDWPTAMYTLGAEAVVRGAGGQRTVPVSELFMGPFMTVLDLEEIVEGVRVPVLSDGARWAYYKVWRKTGDFAESIGAVVVDPDRGFSRVVVGATDGAPIALSGVAESLLGSSASEQAAAFSIDAAKSAITETGASFDSFDLQIHATAVSRAVQEAFAK